MKTSKAKFLSAAVIAAALIATVAVARTVHTHVAAAGAQPAHTSAMGCGPQRHDGVPAARHSRLRHGDQFGLRKARVRCCRCEAAE